MSRSDSPRRFLGRPSAKYLLIASIALGVLLFVGANAHLVYVAVTSSTACVPHAKEKSADAGKFRAAKSSC